MKKTIFCALAALFLAACVHDPLNTPTSSDSTNTTVQNGKHITIGTANFPESEIIGQIWAVALEQEGFDVEVRSGIGSREAYLRALQEGTIDLVPEYSGNLAQYYIKESGQPELPLGASNKEVLDALNRVLPAGLSTGKIAPGESKDAFRVTREFAEQHHLVTLEDLKDMEGLRLAGNPELKDRPYGPKGLEEVYNIPAVELVPISDGGGPLTIAALNDGAAELADIYTTSPTFDADLVTLEDNKNLVLPQHILPLMRGKAINSEARDILNSVTERLTTEALKEMNARNVGDEKKEPRALATEFVQQN
ncbi:ABC transporter substrate-binding protein [Corynebacterium canis]|uniref:ABC transporter substrate-binding protein n=1 Tax=Corynebacterium canis TaxID=679663 RepID=A0A5C5ULB6_9CORY|nr:ABC transporter substrate-binding protein [Corynebacterium canis]TWT26607.1 ABC transporter substrate-binding protein [Corynebacterium canis]WJY76389.1 Glycine betaine/carnitine/choline-binding protein OpuCC precursor [Corynebacterium canis]